MENTARLDHARLRFLLEGQFAVRRSFYWADFLGNLAVGYGAFALSQTLWRTGFGYWGSLVVASIALYRATLFIHELAHLRSQMPKFSVVWNALCGVPLAMPGFLYYQSHFAHHGLRTYGTPADGEYIAFAQKPRLDLLRYVIFSALAPFLLIARFLFLAPLSWAIPPMRKWVIEHASSLVIESTFIGKKPMQKDRIDWIWQETATSLFWWTVVALVVSGTLRGSVVMELLALMSVVHVINATRTVGAHRFNNDGAPLSLEHQYLDSVNLTGTGVHAVANSLMAPVGLRYHALHHLFPLIPYHSLGSAHQKLVTSLPPDSFYHQANEVSLAVALRKLWNRAGGRLPSSAPLEA